MKFVKRYPVVQGRRVAMVADDCGRNEQITTLSFTSGSSSQAISPRMKIPTARLEHDMHGLDVPSASSCDTGQPQDA